MRSASLLVIGVELDPEEVPLVPVLVVIVEDVVGVTGVDSGRGI